MSVYFDNVVGVTFGDCQENIRTLSRGDMMKLIPEPENQFDKNAIRVESSDGRKIGYVKRGGWLQEAIHNNHKFTSEVYQVTGGGDHNFGVVMKLTPITVNENQN